MIRWKMINVRHTGIYVQNIENMTNFYKECFKMTTLVENYKDAGKIYEQLFGKPDVRVIITKLISEYGKVTKTGEMIELIHVNDENGQARIDRRICDLGLSHIAIGVENIAATVERIERNGGRRKTDIITIGERKCCFCEDIEGNGLEIIQ